MDRFLLLYQLVTAQKSQPSDCVIWLQGDRYDRAEKVLDLFQKGFSQKIVVTGNNVLVGTGPRVEEHNVSVGDMVQWLQDHKVPHDTIITDEGSMNTKDQAVFCISLAKKHKWKRLLLVGSSYYQPRAFLTFLKEAIHQSYDGAIINQPAMIDPKTVPGGRKKTTEEYMGEELKKIKKYTTDTVSIEEGIIYIRQSDY